MGNGVIIGFHGVRDLQSDIDKEEQNIQTVKDYYRRIWRDRHLVALPSFLAPNFKLHRDHYSLDTIPKVAIQIAYTQMTFPDLTVDIDQITALKDNVVCRVDVRYTNAQGRNVLMKGVNICTLVNGLITESTVSYQPPYLVP